MKSCAVKALDKLFKLVEDQSAAGLVPISQGGIHCLASSTEGGVVASRSLSAFVSGKRHRLSRDAEVEVNSTLHQGNPAWSLFLCSSMRGWGGKVV